MNECDSTEYSFQVFNVYALDVEPNLLLRLIKIWSKLYNDFVV